MNKSSTILVIDDELGVRESFHMVLKDTYTVLLAETGEEGLDLFQRNRVDAILLDIRLPDVDGLELLEKFKGMTPQTEVIMVTAVTEVPVAVRAIKTGAYEYIIKPFVVEDLLHTIRRALEKKDLVKEVTYLKDELVRHRRTSEMVGNSDEMKKVFELLLTISESSSPVLIQGESGTGKELVARAIHNLGPRRKQPFVVINCAAIPHALLESTLFGHQKGAFTGALNTSVGKLEIADKGIAFLDDIDTLDPGLQAKLLRAIQEKEFEKVGSNKRIVVDVRFVASTNQNLQTLMEERKFREDLYYRLSVFPVNLPPLRGRKKDIPLLLDHFLELNAQNSGRPAKRFSEKSIRRLLAYDWPGNVRELQNLVERSFTIAKDSVIGLEDIAPLNTYETTRTDKRLKTVVIDFERKYTSEILKSVGGNRTRAAEILGIHRNTLQIKLNGLRTDEDVS